MEFKEALKPGTATETTTKACEESESADNVAKEGEGPSAPAIIRESKDEESENLDMLASAAIHVYESSLGDISSIACAMEAELINAENEIAFMIKSRENKASDTGDKEEDMSIQNLSLPHVEEHTNLVEVDPSDLDHNLENNPSSATPENVFDSVVCDDMTEKEALDSLAELMKSVSIDLPSLGMTSTSNFDEKGDSEVRSVKNLGSLQQMSKGSWEEVHLFFQHLASGATKMAAGMGDMSAKIKSLVDEDPYLFYDRLQSILFESAIELRVKILEKNEPGEQFVISLLRSFDAIQKTGSRLKPHIGPLEAKFMSQIETSWDLVPKHFFYKCIFTDTRVHGLMPATVTLLGECEDKMGLIHELYKLDDAMTKVCDRWRHTEEKIKQYHENMLAVKLRRRLLQEEFLLYKAKKAEEEKKKGEAGKIENKKALERSVLDEDIPFTLDYLVTRPRGLACRNASLQDTPPQLCERCGTAQCPCAECTVGHLLTCSLELEPEDMTKDFMGRTLPLEERMSSDIARSNPQMSAEFTELLNQVSLADYGDIDSDDEETAGEDSFSSSHTAKLFGEQRKSPKTVPESLMKLAGAKFLEMQDVSADPTAPKTEPPKPTQLPKTTVDRAMEGKPTTKAPPIPPKAGHHRHGPSCNHDHDHSDESDSSHSESMRSHCDCCHCDGSSVVRNAAMARRYPAIRQRLRSVLERRKAEKLVQQQTTKPRSGHEHSVSKAASHSIPGQPLRPVERPVNLVKGTPHVAHSKQPQPPSKPAQLQPPSKPAQLQPPAKGAQPLPKTTQPPKQALPTRPQLTQTKQQVSTSSNVPRVPHPNSAQSKPPLNIQTATPPKETDSDRSAKIAELLRLAQKSQSAQAVPSKAQPLAKPGQGPNKTAQASGKTVQPASKAAQPASKTPQPLVNTVQPAGKSALNIPEKVQPAVRTQPPTAQNSKGVGALKGQTVTSQPLKQEEQKGKGGKKNKKGDAVTLQDMKKGNKKGVKGKKGKEPPPPPPPPEPKPKSEIEQLLEFIEGAEEKTKEEKPQILETINEKKAAKKARQKERKQTEHLTKQVEEEQRALPADPNGMVRIVHDPITQRAVITPVQPGFQQQQQQPPFPFMSMGGGPNYNQYPVYPGQHQGQYQGQQGQYQSHPGQYQGYQGQYQSQQQFQGQPQGYYPQMGPQTYPGVQQGYGGYQQQQQGPVYQQNRQSAPLYQQSQPAANQSQPPIALGAKAPGPMVTLRRVADNGPESKVTVTLKGEEQGREKILFTLVNGHVREAKEGPASTQTQPGDALTKTAQKKLKKAAKQQQSNAPTQTQANPTQPNPPQANHPVQGYASPAQNYSQMGPQYPVYPSFHPSMMPSFPIPQLQPPKMEPPKPKPIVTAPRQRIQTVPLDDNEDFDIKSLKLPPGITVTRVLHQDGYRDPIFPQVSQIQKPSAVVQPSPQPNIIVVDTREMAGSPKDPEAQAKSTAASKKKKKKKRAGNSASGNGEDTWDADSIFAPKENPNDLDETERELEAFKRFCLDSRPADPSAKLKVNLNVKDIFSRAKNGSS